VLSDFLKDGRLETIPRQRKKREVILRHLARQFDAARTYDETEVNAILAAYNADVATLRREMVSYGLLSRSGGEYRRAHETGA
jgi:hypothetical protein